MDRDINDYPKNCLTCRTNTNKPVTQPITKTDLPERFCANIIIDLFEHYTKVALESLSLTYSCFTLSRK